jgi:hypothetical protein
MAEPEILSNQGFLPCGVHGCVPNVIRAAWRQPPYHAACPERSCQGESNVGGATPSDVRRLWNSIQPQRHDTMVAARHAQVKADSIARTPMPEARPGVTPLYPDGSWGFRDVYWCWIGNEPGIVRWIDEHPQCPHCGMEEVRNDPSHTFVTHLCKPTTYRPAPELADFTLVATEAPYG